MSLSIISFILAAFFLSIERILTQILRSKYRNETKKSISSIMVIFKFKEVLKVKNEYKFLFFWEVFVLLTGYSFGILGVILEISKF